MTLLLSLLLLLSTPAMAQVRPTGSGVLQILSTEDGLPQNWVTEVTQTADGTLWIGTNNGLARYDGVELESLSGLAGKEVGQLVLGPGDRLWVATLGQIWRLTGGELVEVPLAIGEVRRPLVVDAQGEVWINVGRSLVALDGSQREVDLRGACGGALELQGPRALVRCVLDGRLHRFDGGKLEALLGVDGSPVAGEGALELRRGDLIVLEGRLPRRLLLEPAGYSALPGSLGGATEIVALMEGRGGEIWLGRDDGQVLVWDGATLEGRSILKRVTRRFFEDREGNVWAATRGLGLVRLSAPGSFSVWTEGLPDALVWCLIEDPRGGLWVGTEGGLAHIEGDEVRVFTTRDGLPGDVVYSLHLDAQGTLWIGTKGGLARQVGGRIEAIEGGEASVRGGLLEDRSGRIWVGTAGGVSRLEGDTLVSVELPVELGSAYPAVSTILEDRDGRIWVATSAGALVLEGGRWTVLPVGHVRTLYEGPSGVLWASLAGRGLLRIVGTQVSSLGSAQGLMDTAIHGIVEDDRGQLWLSTNRGIFTLKLAELEVAAGNPAAQLSPRAYGIVDGLRSLEFNSGSPPALGASDGTLWFPSMDGAANVDPTRVVSHTLAPVPVIRQVLVDSTEVALPLAGSLPPQTRSVAVAYSAASLLDPKGISYRYRLEGYDADWVDAGSRRQALWTNLLPGDYRFRLLASSRSGATSEAEATVAFTIEPHFTQTGWFWALVILGSVGLLGAIYRWRLRYLRERELTALVDARTADLQTAQRHSEAQAEELERLSAIKTRFFANVSHELRTPLSLILGPVDAALESSEPLSPENLERLSRSAHRLRQLIDELLDIARLDSGHLPLYATEGDLGALLEGRAALFQPLARRQGVSLHAEAAPLRVWFDRERMEKVLDNLISNALRYTPDGGSIVLCLVEEEARARVEVRDSGVGIAAEALPHIFERFYQVVQDGQRPTGGGGIGLSLCQELVTRHGGEITAQSTPGEGTTVTILLPLGRDHLDDGDVMSASEASPVATRALLPPPTGAATVLVVEDHPDMRAWIRQVLAPRFSVLEAEDGETGLALARDQIPDLVVSDVMMPGMDGLALCRALRLDPSTSHLPVVLLTARASAESRLEGREHGADAFLAKPFQPRELVVVLENLLRVREGMQARHLQSLVVEAAAIEEPSADAVFLGRVRAAVEARLSESDFGVFELADDLSMSRRQLGRKLTGLTGQAPSAVIRQIRLHRARAMLEQGVGNVSEVAYATGYSKPSRFTEHFRAEFGEVPSEVRKRARQEAATARERR